jgi:hypothetical protein
MTFLPSERILLTASPPKIRRNERAGYSPDFSFRGAGKRSPWPLRCPKGEQAKAVFPPEAIHMADREMGRERAPHACT